MIRSSSARKRPVAQTCVSVGTLKGTSSYTKCQVGSCENRAGKEFGLSSGAISTGASLPVVRLFTEELLPERGSDGLDAGKSGAASFAVSGKHQLLVHDLPEVLFGFRDQDLRMRLCDDF